MLILKILAAMLFIVVIAIGIFASAMFYVLFASEKRISREEEQRNMKGE